MAEYQNDESKKPSREWMAREHAKLTAGLRYLRFHGLIVPDQQASLWRIRRIIHGLEPHRAAFTAKLAEDFLQDLRKTASAAFKRLAVLGVLSSALCLAGTFFA